MENVERPELQRAAEAAYRAGLRAGLPEVDASDLAQEALLRALSSARPPDQVALSAWTYGIARNLARDHLKSAHARLVVHEAVESTAPDEDLPTVLAVRQAVRDLPEPLRDVISFHELEERSLRETAAALAIPFDTAKDRLRRARDHLREQFADLGAEKQHARRRSAAAGPAILAAVFALGERTAAAATTATVAWLSWKAAVAALVLIFGGFAAGRITAPTVESPARAVVAQPTPEPEPAPPVHVETSPPVDDPAPIPPTARAAVRQPRNLPTPAPAPAPREGSAAEERLMIDRARSGLHRGMSDEAIVVLMSHARRFPSGVLAEERAVLLIDAYLRQGNQRLARRSVDHYRASYPAGALRSRVDVLARNLEPAAQP